MFCHVTQHRRGILEVHSRVYNPFKSAAIWSMHGDASKPQFLERTLSWNLAMRRDKVYNPMEDRRCGQLWSDKLTRRPAHANPALTLRLAGKVALMLTWARPRSDSPWWKHARALWVKQQRFYQQWQCEMKEQHSLQLYRPDWLQTFETFWH